MIPYFLIPYSNDATYLVSLGDVNLIPLYFEANAVDTWTVVMISLKIFNSSKLKMLFPLV